MRIKKTKNNEYIYASGIWIRNFTKKNSKPFNRNEITSREDQALLAKNEKENSKKGYADISEETVNFSKIVIVSDGYNFEEKHKIISKFPNDVSVITVNGALKKWEMNDRENSDNFRTINIYLANNPYVQCLKYLPAKGRRQYFPTCVASTRTNPDFLEKYQGNIYSYNPVPEIEFGYDKKSRYLLDDYRNPICAAIGLAYRFGVEKLMLMSCDDAFEDQRDGAMQLKNNLWMYPQQKIAKKIIDANLFWLNNCEEEIEIVNYSDGADYVNAVYIKTEEEAVQFFKDEEELNEEPPVSA